MPQVFAVLKQQADDLRPFGQIAIDLGFLTNEDLQELLLLQTKQERPVTEILVEMHCLSGEDIEAERLTLRQQMTMRSEIFDREESLC